MKSDIAPVAQMLERIERIEGSGVDRQRFLESVWNQDALVRNLEVLGEAAKRVSAGTRARSPSVPWKQLMGFRDVAIHGYDRLDLERIWSFVERDLPTLKATLRQLLREIGDHERRPGSA